MTGFYGEVAGTRYPAALVAQSGGDLYIWTWFDTPGTILCLNCDGTERRFYQVVERHKSLHASGEVHSRVVMKSGAKDTLAGKEGWRDFEITVPLDSIPPEALKGGPWKKVTREIVLRSADLENAPGANLIFCLATPRTIAELRRCRAHWILKGDRTLVIGAEPYPRNVNPKRFS